MPRSRFGAKLVFLISVCAHTHWAATPVLASVAMGKGLFRAAAASAKKMTTPTKAANKTAVGMARLQKKTLERIIELLSERPEQAPLVLMVLENGDYENSAVDDTQFDPKMTKMSQIPKYWLASQLNSWQPKLTKTSLEALDSAEPETIRRLVEFATGVDAKSWRLPRSALCKQVLAKTLLARYTAYGCRLSDKWLAGAVKSSTIEWQNWGVYRWTPTKDASEQAIALETVNGTQADLPTDCRFSTKAGIQETWSDVRAAIRTGWRPSADRVLFKDTKNVASSHPKVFDHECESFANNGGAEILGNASSGSAASSAPTAASARAPAITEDNTTIGQGRRKAKKPGFSHATASLVLVSWCVAPPSFPLSRARGASRASSPE